MAGPHNDPESATETTHLLGGSSSHNSNSHHGHHHRGLTDGVAPEGESGRSGFHLSHFLHITWLSSNPVASYVNLLWPFVPLAIILHFVLPSKPLLVFAMAYIGMVPAANLIGFAGQELARKLPKVSGILIETALGGIVEIVLFVVLIVKHVPEGSGEEHGLEDAEEGNLIPVIQAAILGSILTNLLLCLGLCFFVGGIRHAEQTFHASVSEVGTGLLLVAGFGLLIPSAFYSALKSEAVREKVLGVVTAAGHEYTKERLESDIMRISQITSIFLIIAFAAYIWFNALSQHSIFDEILEKDEMGDADRAQDMQKPKFTFTECVIALVIALTLVTMLAIFLVERIEDVVHSGVPDQFLGLILLPLVEKAAEHLTAVDEAWDGTMNLALFHCLAPSIQTALLNAPLVVLVGWAIGKPMDLNFEIFMIALLVLSILVVGNFLRDGASNWLEGFLLVVVYGIVAVASWYYPNPDVATSNGVAI